MILRESSGKQQYNHYSTVARKAEVKPTIQMLHAECFPFFQHTQHASNFESPACLIIFLEARLSAQPNAFKTSKSYHPACPTLFKAPQAPPSSRLQTYLKHREHHHAAGPHSYYQYGVSRMRGISGFTSESTLVVCKDTLTSYSMVHLRAFQTKVNRPHKPALICCSKKSGTGN